MKSFSLDAKLKTVRGKFKPSSQAERDFARSLKKIAKASAGIIDSHIDEGDELNGQLRNAELMQKELEAYSKRLEPWARRQAQKMITQVSKSNASAYKSKLKQIKADQKKMLAQSRQISMGLAEEMVGPTGLIAQELMNEQVTLIRSIPTEAGLRAQNIALKMAVEGRRAQPDRSIIDQLMQEQGMTEQVATNRAKLIARTETARANASINQSRAMLAGSNQYRWHNSGDGAVRESHKRYKGQKLQGMVFSWDNPPTLDDGMTGHPGTFPNCRCFAEPVFLDE